jgi:hypothetical protein
MTDRTSSAFGDRALDLLRQLLTADTDGDAGGVEAVLALEEELDVKIPEEEMEGVKTVGQAVELVLVKRGVSA